MAVDDVQRMEECASNIRLETMLCCMPLRLGILLTSAVIFFTGIQYCWNTVYYAGYYRHETGGYGLYSQIAVQLFGISGVFFGLMGILGTWYLRRTHIVGLSGWLFLRILVYVPVFYNDIPLLRTCEMWVDDVQTMTAEYGWNQIMYDIALRGYCPEERIACAVRSAVSFLFLMHVAWATFRYSEYIGHVPKHLLRAPKDMDSLSGAFFATSIGERRAAENKAMPGGYGAQGMMGQPMRGPMML